MSKLASRSRRCSAVLVFDTDTRRFQVSSASLLVWTRSVRLTRRSTDCQVNFAGTRRSVGSS